ncbi:MAG: hypothetical protein LBK94_00715 [Prevotellaceae bacterium]|jgi:hypothetical protein|nr:hypothetical protein [Prevotellaceae bacterium]
MTIHINDIQLEINVTDESYRYRAIKGDNMLTLYYSLAEHVEIPLGAWTEFEGQRYELLQPENFKKNHTRNFEYTLIMEAEQSKLKRYRFREVVIADDGEIMNYPQRLKFSYTAQPQQHVKMLVDNLNMRDSGWQVGECVEAVEKVISFNHTTCWDALGQISDTFETEWEINGKTIHLKKVEYNKDNALPLSYGKGNGFKPGLGRTNQNNVNPVEILFVQGGDRNIDSSKYGNTELLLPKNQILEYEDRNYISDADGFSIQRLNVPLKTKTEDSLDCSHIYPSRVGTVSEVDIVNEEKHFYDIIDSSIPDDLDYRQYMIAGETMTIIFQDGMLAGKEFDINYSHSERRIKIVPQEIDGRIMPDNIFCPLVGQKYAIFGMMLPDAYICDNATKTGASWDMFREAAKYFYEHEEPCFSFTGELDGIWAKNDWLNIGGKIKLGGYVLFSDAQFEQDGVLIRITGIKDYVNNPHSPMIELSNKPIGTSFIGMINKIEENEVVADDLHQNAIAFTKRRYRDAIETLQLLEDALLENYMEAIRPIAVHTMQILVGDESLQFVFVTNKANKQRDLNFEVFFNPDNKILTVTPSILQHLTITETDVNGDTIYKFWDIPLFESPPLTNNSQSYYIYANVSTDGTEQNGIWTGADAEFVISETAIAINSVQGRYYLLVGLLNSMYSSDRSFVSLYGFTEIRPGQIATDSIVSGDGQSFFDLARNAFKLGKGDRSIDWNVTQQNTLTLSNATVRESLKVLGDALIAGWIFNNTQIRSQESVQYGNATRPKVLLDGLNSRIEIISNIINYFGDDGESSANGLQKISISADGGGIRVDDNDYNASIINSNGIFANCAGMKMFAPSSGSQSMASIVGLGFGNMDKSFFGGEFIAGVYGGSSNGSSNPAPDYGGYFMKLRADGFYPRLNCKTGTSSDNIINATPTDTYIVANCSNVAMTVNLPKNPQLGQAILIKHQGGNNTTIVGRVKISDTQYEGYQIYRNTLMDSMTLSNGDNGLYIYDGAQWNFGVLSH